MPSHHDSARRRWITRTALATACALACCGRRESAQTNPPDHAAPAPAFLTAARPPTANLVEVGGFACSTFARCLAPFRKAIAATDPGTQIVSALEHAFVLERPVHARLFAVSPIDIHVVVELPLHKGDSAEKLRDLGLPLAGADGTLTLDGKPARIVGDRLLVGTSRLAVDTAARATTPTPTFTTDAIFAGSVELAKVPAEIRAAMIRRLEDNAQSEQNWLKQAGRFQRVQSAIDALTHGKRASVALRTRPDGLEELSVVVEPKPGSPLEARARASTSLVSRLATIVPAASPLRGSWATTDPLTDAEIATALRDLNDLEKLLPTLATELDLPAGSEDDVIDLARRVLGLTRSMFERRRLDGVLFTSADAKTLVFGVDGLPGGGIGDLLARSVQLAKRYPVPWLKSVSTKKKRRRTTYEAIVVTPEAARTTLGDTIRISSATEGDAWLVVIEGAGGKSSLPILLDRLARGKPIAVPVQDFHVDVAVLLDRLLDSVIAKLAFASLFLAKPGAFAIDYRNHVEGTSLIQTVRFDLESWLEFIQRTRSKLNKAAAPKRQSI